MKKIRNLIIALVILIIIIVSAIFMLKAIERKEEESDVFKVNDIQEGITKNRELHIEENRNRFYIVKSCINKFYDAYQKMNPDNLDINTEFIEEELNKTEFTIKYQERVYAMLDKEYINYSNITVDNIKEKLGKIPKTSVEVDRIFTKDLDNSEYICFIEGRLQEQNSKKEENYKMIIRLSNTNNFKILLQDYMKNNDYIDFTKDINIEKLIKTEITEDQYNTFKNEVVSVKEYVNDLFKHYKSAVIKNAEYAYQLIDNEYKKIKFESNKEYLSYVKDNYTSIVTSRLEAYNQKTIDRYTEFLCQDNYGRYYIFKETAPFQYTVMLDNYTIPTEDFIETYNSSTEVEKVVLNIKRFFMGIDDKNYGYSYSVLSQAFKQNKYPTKDKFVQYVKQNFFEENKIQYISCEKQNGLYIYKIKITDATGKSTEAKSLNMIVKLNNGTDFEMSFGTN